MATTLQSALPWVEKYRPSSIEDMVQQGSSFNTSNKAQFLSILVSSLIDSNRLPHLLFYGPPGTGKTTAVQAIIKKLFGSNIESNVLEVPWILETIIGINIVRNQIKTFVSTRSIFSSISSLSLKIVIMDEADAMTNAAQDALRRIIEKYVQHARFFFICNDVTKISMAIQSRCMLFRFSPLSPGEMMPRLDYVIEKENLTLTCEGKKALLDISSGDMRKVFNILQSTAASTTIIDEEAICHNCGVPSKAQIDLILEKLLNSDYLSNYLYLTELIIGKGYAILDIIRILTEKLLLFEIPDLQLGYLLERLAFLEYAASSGIPENIQISNLIGSFQAIRSI